MLAAGFFVLLNGFFVAAEFALVKTRRERLNVLVEQGSKSAKLTLYMLDHLDLYLSSCQLGVTLCSLILGWLAEPAFAAALLVVAQFVGFSPDPRLLHGVALALALLIVTVLHMTIGEQAPKIWAIKRTESMVRVIAYPLYMYTMVFRPFIWFINTISNLLLRIVGIASGAAEEPIRDVDEIREIIARSANAGHLTHRQKEFAQNILSIARLEVRHILVPRADIVYLAADHPIEENLRIISDRGHSRFPLCRDGLDSIIGIVHTKSILVACTDRAELNLENLMRPAIYLPDSMPLSRMIHELQEAKSGCAVAVDEHGSTVGLAFLEDALEEIVGPISDEFDEYSANVKTITEGIIEISGGASIPEASEILSLKDLGDDDTIGGYVTSLLRRMPKAGDRLFIGPYQVTVLDVKQNRTHWLRFERDAAKLDDGAK